MEADVTQSQLDVLKWVAEGCPDDDRWPNHNGHKASARALANRKLIVVDSSYRGWSAEITDAGSFYLEHNRYPDGHRLHNIDLTPTRPNPERESKRGSQRQAKSPPKSPEPQFVSPREERRRRKAEPFEGDPHLVDSWDDKILVTVKEAAWLLSVDEGMIRRAVRDGDLHRVYIGQGDTRYRVVYQSLLAWVDAMPREPIRGW